MTTTQALRLFDLLKQNETLRKRGFSLSCDRDGGIVVDRLGHVRGIWDSDGRSYTWITPGSSEPIFHTTDAGAAVLYTVVTLTQGL